MAFAEALKIARDARVDFILLGGDLFHKNVPSATIEHKCIKIIRQHMNAETSRGTSFRCLSGNFSHSSKLNHPNFEDPNFNVPSPILTIHGNHDDPTGPKGTSVCEKLATCGLLNYFGAMTLNPKGINIVTPIILQKGKIKLALYGIGFIPDAKLKLVIDDGRLVFEDPPQDTFNILVVHQNRVPHVEGKFIPDSVFPSYFHLIIRGHEHDTQWPTPLPGSQVEGMVYQPGSTVATSIGAMEAAQKRVGLFSIRINNSVKMYKMDYELKYLQCSRRMIFKDIPQRDIFKYIKKATGTNKVTAAQFKKQSKDYVELCIKELLQIDSSQRAESSSSMNSSAKSHRFDLPLMRLRLEYSSKSERFDEVEIANQYYPSQVANRDIIRYKKQKLKQIDSSTTENITFADVANDDDEDDFDEFDPIDLDKRQTIDNTIENYFKDKKEEDRLKVLSIIEYTKAVRSAAEEGSVISKVLSKRKHEIIKNFRAHVNDPQKTKSNQFSNEESVNRYFLTAYCHHNNQMFGGDENIEVIQCD